MRLSSIVLLFTILSLAYTSEYLIIMDPEHGLPYCQVYRGHSCPAGGFKGSCLPIKEPVIAFLNDSSYLIYDNFCFACLNPAVTQYSEVHRFSYKETNRKCSDNPNPVCMITPEGSLQEFRNPCLASVYPIRGEYFFYGKCPEPINPEARKVFQCEYQSNQICTSVRDPICGMDQYGNQKNYYNPCKGCQANIRNYTKGVCYEIIEKPLTKPLLIH